MANHDEADDIEKQLLNSPLHHQLSPPNSATTTITKDPNTSSTIVDVNTDNGKDDDKADAEASSGDAPQPQPDPDAHKPEASIESDPIPATKLGKCLRYTQNALVYTLTFLFFLVLFPCYLLYMAGAWLICNVDVTKDEAPTHSDAPPGKKDFFTKVYEAHETARRLAKLPKKIRSRVVIIVGAWVIVNLTVPGLKQELVLGSELWKWTLLVAMVSCGYHIIGVVTQFLLHLLCSNARFKKNENVEYFAQGMRQSVNLLVLSGSVLLTWVLYFRTSHGIKKNDETDVVLHVGTWSFVTLAVAAVLWVLKSVLLLKWEADAVYRRFKGRILREGSRCYFILLHLGIFQPKHKDDQTNQDNSDDQDLYQVNQAEEPTTVEVDVVASGRIDNPGDKEPSMERTTTPDQKEDMESKNLEKRHKKAKGILCIDNDKGATLYDIKKMTKYFVILSRESSREDDGTNDVLKQCRKAIPRGRREMFVTKAGLMDAFHLEENDAQKLYSKLQDEHPQITYNNFEKSMVKAHTNCVALGHTLLDAGEVVKVLNQVMTGVLIALVFIAWLLLTDIATTKILILIASPLLAVTFVFGGTCKNIFENFFSK